MTGAQSSVLRGSEIVDAKLSNTTMEPPNGAETYTYLEVALAPFAAHREAVSAPSKAWRFLQGESPCGVRTNHPLLPSVATATEEGQTEQVS